MQLFLSALSSVRMPSIPAHIVQFLHSPSICQAFVGPLWDTVLMGGFLYFDGIEASPVEVHPPTISLITSLKSLLPAPPFPPVRPLSPPFSPCLLPEVRLPDPRKWLLLYSSAWGYHNYPLDTQITGFFFSRRLQSYTNHGHHTIMHIKQLSYPRLGEDDPEGFIEFEATQWCFSLIF